MQECWLNVAVLAGSCSSSLYAHTPDFGLAGGCVAIYMMEQVVNSREGVHFYWVISRLKIKVYL